jgi:hypothetical protein
VQPAPAHQPEHLLAEQQLQAFEVQLAGLVAREVLVLPASLGSLAAALA